MMQCAQASVFNHYKSSDVFLGHMQIVLTQIKPFHEKKCVCSSITFKPGLCPKVLRLCNFSSLSALNPNDLIGISGNTKESFTRIVGFLSKHPPLLLLYSHVVLFHIF